MKAYKIITKGNGSLMNQAIYNRYMMVDPSKKFMWLIATTTLAQAPSFGLNWTKPEYSEEVELETIPWVLPHLPKIIKKELGILK